MPRKKPQRKPKPLTVDTLDIKHTPDRVNKARPGAGTQRGKKYGLGVQQFLYRLFEINEQLPRVKKMTDTEIVRQIVDEYAEYKTTVRHYSDNKYSVHQYRYKHNQGWQAKDSPEFLSFKYNNDGYPCYHGFRVMNEERKLQYRAQFTSSFLDSPGILKEGVTLRNWMLPLDDPRVTEAFEKRVARNLKRFGKESREWEG